MLLGFSAYFNNIIVFIRFVYLFVLSLFYSLFFILLFSNLCPQFYDAALIGLRIMMCIYLFFWCVFFILPPKFYDITFDRHSVFPPLNSAAFIIFTLLRGAAFI